MEVFFFDKKPVQLGSNLDESIRAAFCSRFSSSSSSSSSSRKSTKRLSETELPTDGSVFFVEPLLPSISTTKSFSFLSFLRLFLEYLSSLILTRFSFSSACRTEPKWQQIYLTDHRAQYHHQIL
ncbi:hypothetical protein ACJIZ3_004950 [Penstemon smallii]|uniref:Uncharacterized protein n=1 Tax=Penstemon smallii TaxID=265156 RepID=A0ABD3S3J2_9LAMI